MREINKNICIVLHTVLSFVSPHVHDLRESKTVLDSGFHVVDSGFRILDFRSFSGFLRFQLLVGFGISTAVFRIPQAELFKILDSTFENLPHSGILYMSRSVSNAKARIRARLRNSPPRNSRDFAAQILSLQIFEPTSLYIKCFVIFLVFHFNSNKRITAVNQNKRTNSIPKTTERTIYKVLSLHYLHLFPPLAAVSPLG